MCLGTFGATHFKGEKAASHSWLVEWSHKRAGSGRYMAPSVVLRGVNAAEPSLNRFDNQQKRRCGYCGMLVNKLEVLQA